MVSFTRARSKKSIAASGAAIVRQSRPDRLQSQSRRTDDTPVLRLDEHCGIFALGRLLGEAQRRALPVGERTNRADHVHLLEGAAAILAAPDRGFVVMVEADQQHPAASFAVADLDQQLIAAAAELGRS